MNAVNDTVHEPSALAYYVVFLALVALLALTLKVAFLPLGAWKIAAAMAIATVKACLVIWYFMHLRSHPRLAMMLFGMSFVMIAIGATVMLADYLTR